LDGLLYEAVLDPDVRTKLKESQGFCPRHVEMLTRRPGRALGIALIYRDILRDMLKVLDRARYEGGRGAVARLLGRGEGGAALTVNRLTPDKPCPACGIGATAEENYLNLLLAHLDDDQLYDAYAAGEGLCLPHFLRALERVPDRETFERLVRPQAERYRLMMADLDEFIRKRDHRFTGEKYGEEGDVWLRVLNVVVGGAGRGLSAKSGGRRASDIDDETR
jgi:hypothetical protein